MFCYFAPKFQMRLFAAKLKGTILLKEERLSHYPLLNPENSQIRVISKSAHAWFIVSIFMGSIYLNAWAFALTIVSRSLPEPSKDGEQKPPLFHV